MTDIIWGNVVKILSDNTFELNVTHQKDSNKEGYPEIQIVEIDKTDIVSIPVESDQRSVATLEQNLMNQFVKCEIKEKKDNLLVADVSHSGQGGY
ncbi:MAG: hypothetical protein DWQ18_03235 [Crenarchaeota archaeon]|nr:MAG: hypothetical protein DWQ17_05295 [Thermoproteota archaeon]RDJ33936.1 MAG: hypothetical protein DWQ18_03235 [Thermoproteota archaeon]RDJ36952.1 MAG: hypothetical protein DWQ13_07385 [Thermoproteota archaeon]RDJ37513.1 MAG: hypothetical protein DWQ19_03450 [Thermoproteota archaeon]